MGPIAWLRYEEPAARKAENMKTGQKPDWVSWEEWTDPRLGNPWFEHCHWYDPKKLTPTGHCSGRWRHDHQSARMGCYWKSPLGKIVPAIWELWQFGPWIVSGLLKRIGWYRLLERFGVDTSPR
jgi:hypothetical protein